MQMPILLLPDGTSLPESEVITQYLLDKCGGGMRAATPELRAIAALAVRIHDQYITPIQVSSRFVGHPTRAS
jgi:glutathione S-transferase